MIKKRIATVAIICVALVALSGLYRSRYLIDYEKIIEIDGELLKAQVVTEPEEKRTGLSQRRTLESGEGMLFVFEKSDFHGIWMRDMDFSIDIIWIDENKLIVDIATNVSPETYPDVFRPEKPAKYVLEVKAGYVESRDLQKGDRLDFDL